MGEHHGMNHTTLKNRNRGLVLSLIATSGELSRPDLVRLTGLTKMTITNIVGEMIEQGLVEEHHTESPTVGRSAALLDIAAKAPKAVGLYLSRESVSVILTDLRLRVLFFRSLPLSEETPESLGDKLAALAGEAVGQTDDPLLGIGISSIGPLDRDTRTLLSPPNFFGIGRFPLAERLEQQYALPILLQNDMDAAALAEKLYGRGRWLDNFLYLGLTNGIGSGIVLNGRLYPGSRGFSGEIGHLSIDLNGPLCSCGNRGCLETYVNMPAIRGRLAEATGRETVDCAEFEALSLQPACAAVFDDVADKLAVALTGAVNLLDPRCILIGHDGIWLPDSCLSRLEAAVNRRILAGANRPVTVRRSAFGSRAPLLGSVCPLCRELFSGHTLRTLS